jgi:peptide/nickel transport system permease protein
VLALAWLTGGVAGYRGGWVDECAMRVTDLFLVLPWFYLLIGIRALLPLSLPPRAAFGLLLVVIALVSWARPARLVRGLVLAARENGYVQAAIAFGVPGPVVFVRHILPGTAHLLATQALLLLPRFILAEVSLSFLGLGLGEPDPSWGALLIPLKQAWRLGGEWWRLLPALCLFPVLIGFSAVARRWSGPSERSTLR